MQWFYAKDGEQIGPIEEEQLRQMVADGQLAQDALIWRGGMTEWEPYSVAIGSALAPIQGEESTAASSGAEARYPLKEMGIGEILDMAIKLLRNHFKLLFTISCYIAVPASLFVSFLIIVITPQVDQNNPQSPEAIMAMMAPMWGILILFGLINGFLIAPLTNGATIAGLAHEYLSKGITPGYAMKIAWRRLGALILTNLLAGIFIFLGYIVLVVPGIYLSLKYCLANQIVITENRMGIDALTRSGELMKGSYTKAVALGLVFIVVSLMIQTGTNFVPNQYIATVVQVIVRTILFILGTAATVVLYYSARCQHDNFDLEVLSQSVSENAT